MCQDNGLGRVEHMCLVNALGLLPMLAEHLLTEILLPVPPGVGCHLENEVTGLQQPKYVKTRVIKCT